MYSSQGAGHGAELRRVKAANVGIRNRLLSISDDAAWLSSTVLPLLPGTPVFTNRRCGTWYADPSRCTSCYFKSTDGHAGGWAFSLARMNLHLALACVTHGRCIIVDSTKYGKRFSDALVKTIPLWCAVLNRVVLGEGRAPPLSDLLPSWIPPSERDQIQQVIDRTVAAMDASICGAIVETLGPVMQRPLEPLWWCQPSSSAAPARATRFDSRQARGGASCASDDAAWASVHPC